MFTPAFLALTMTTSSPDLGPNALQKQLIQRGYGMFIHFGINTFNETEWSDGKLPVSSYAPTHLNVDSWIKTAKEAGFRHVVLITKHHDGFCLWPTLATDYSVASSPVKTDVVGEAAKACKKYGIKLGLYYSLWDRHEPLHNAKDPTLYVDFMKKQMTELLTHYGPICEIWFDGGWAKKPADWYLPDIYSLIHKLQPGCAVTVNHTIGSGTDPKPIGQPENFKKGDIVRYWPVDFRSKDPNIARTDDPKLYTVNGQLTYLPFEHTICLSDRWNWFQKKGQVPARPVDELEELFYWCTGNDNVMLLNVPPDQTGNLRQDDVDAVLALADRLGIRGGKKVLPKRGPNLIAGAHTTAPAAIDTTWTTFWTAPGDGAQFEVHPDHTVTFDRVTLAENADMVDLGDGFSQERHFRIEAFTLEAKIGGVWKVICEGTHIGSTLSLKLPRMSTDALRFTVKKANGQARLAHFGVYDSRMNRAR